MHLNDETNSFYPIILLEIISKNSFSVRRIHYTHSDAVKSTDEPLDI